MQINKTLATIFVIVVAVSNVNAITWNGNWALGCDFVGNDLSNALTKGEDCGGRCAATSGMPHQYNT